LILLGNKQLHYNGGLLGVSADVVLTETPPRACITLRGVPVGGLLTGGATYDRDYNVQLDGDLERKLSRLRVSILSVKPSVDFHSVFVVVRLPFFLGRHNITLSLTHASSTPRR